MESNGLFWISSLQFLSPAFFFGILIFLKELDWILRNHTHSSSEPANALSSNLYSLIVINDSSAEANHTLSSEIQIYFKNLQFGCFAVWP